MVPKVREHFGRLDTDRDGFLTKPEAEAGRAAMKAVMADRLGKKGDRERRLERRDPNAAFDRLDANKDGSISRDEFAKAREKRIERRVEMQGRPAGRGPKAPAACGCTAWAAWSAAG